MEELLGSVPDQKFAQVWKVVEEIGVQERHFNQLQSTYRNMASAWLAATFAGFGWAFSQSGKVFIDRDLMIAGISAAGAVGIGLLWILDLLVYHRLLDACFVEGLSLEKTFAWLPPIRSNMMATQGGRGVLFRTVGFYLAPIILLIAIAGSSLSLWLYSHAGVLAASLGLLLTLAGAVLAARLIQTRTENTAAIEAGLAALGPNGSQ